MADSAPKAVAGGFNPDTIVHGILQPLFAAEVVFRRLYTHVTEQKLDLLDLCTGNSRQGASGNETKPTRLLLDGGEVFTIEFAPEKWDGLRDLLGRCAVLRPQLIPSKGARR